MSMFTRWLSSWRRAAPATDPERCPSSPSSDDERRTISTETPKSMASSTPSMLIPTTPTATTSTDTTSTDTTSTATTPTQSVLTRLTAVGLRRAFLTPPAWAVPVYTTLVVRFHNRLRYFHERGTTIADFLLGTNPARQRVGNDGDERNGVIALPQETRDSPRYRWARSTIRFMVLVGAMALAGMVLQRFARLPQSRAFYHELLEIVRRFQASALT